MQKKARNNFQTFQFTGKGTFTNLNFQTASAVLLVIDLLKLVNEVINLELKLCINKRVVII